MKRVLVYLDEEAVDDSVELLEVGRRLYGDTGYCSYALAAGGRSGDAGNLFDFVFRISNGALPNYDAAAVARCIDSLHREYRFDAILVPATHWGRMIAPRAAMRLGAGLVADVTDVGVEDDDVLMVRPAYGGRMLATIVCRGGGPVMMSVRPKAFACREPVRKTATFVDVAVQDALPAGVRLIERQAKPVAGTICDSHVLVSGGGGAIHDFHLLERLAQALHGRVAASRKAVDLGKAPRAIQVGQSGKIVSPRLYIAVGISGSTAHLAGIRNAEYIISVNQDRQAPICSLSDIVVEGDGRMFVEQLLDRLEASSTSVYGG